MYLRKKAFLILYVFFTFFDCLAKYGIVDVAGDRILEATTQQLELVRRRQQFESGEHSAELQLGHVSCERGALDYY